jgi:small subunit ribosomal protein S1
MGQRATDPETADDALLTDRFRKTLIASKASKLRTDAGAKESLMLKPERTHPSEPGVVFFAMPFGTKTINGAEPCNFDTIYTSAFAPTVEACGMKPERLDNLYGPQGVLELIWWAIQRAEIVVIDFSFRNANVTFEYGLAWTLGKRVIALTQDPEDIPSDVRGLNRYIRYSQHFADIAQMKQDLTLQLKALRDEPADERAPMPYIQGGMTTVAAPATVVAVNHDFALVKTEDGRLGVLRGADVDYTRIITDMTRRYAVGDPVNGAFLVDPKRGEARYSLLAGQTNPWTVLASRFPVGTVFTGVVRKHIDKTGVLVGLDSAVNALLPTAEIPGPYPLIGDSIEVVVTKMEPAHRRAWVRFRHAPATSAGRSAVASQPLPSVGHAAYGTVARAVPEHDGRGGFILVNLPGYPRTALLLAQHMTEDLRTDMNNEQVEVGEEVYVEVISVDPEKNKVLVRELPEPTAGTE